MASVFGQTVRWCFRHSATDPRLPWDSRSEYSRMNGVLFSFETYSDTCDATFEMVRARYNRLHEAQDPAAACHFTFAHVLYHLSQCLLHHPFFLRQCLGSYKTKAPPSFLREAISKNRHHAVSITNILSAVHQHQTNIYPSFYGYAAIMAGVIHRLHMKHSESKDDAQTIECWKTCVAFLDQDSSFWPIYKRMVCHTSSYGVQQRCRKLSSTDHLPESRPERIRSRCFHSGDSIISLCWI